MTFWTTTSYKGAFPVTDETSDTDWTDGWSNFDPQHTPYTATITTILESNITQNTTINGVVLLKI